MKRLHARRASPSLRPPATAVVVPFLKTAPLLVMLEELFAELKYTDARCTVALRTRAHSRVRGAQLGD
jgi:hypothetical protein